MLKSPTADFNLSADSLCFNNSKITVNNTSNVYNGKNKYYWHYGNIIDSLENPNAFSFKSIGKYDILLIVTDGLNCVDSITKTVSIFPNSVLKLTINDSVQCYGQNQFTITPQSSDKINLFQWYLNGNLTDNTPVFALSNITTAGQHKVSLVATNENKCVDSISDWIRVLPAFKADFNINKDTQCLATNSFNFTDNAQQPQDAIVNQYYSENGGIIGNGKVIMNHQYATAGSHEILYFIETENACRDSAYKSIFIVEEPTASFVSDSVCLGQNISLKGVQVAGELIVLWQWQLGDGTSLNGNPVDYQYRTAGTFTPELKVTDKFGCFSTTKGANQIYPLPNANFSYSVMGSSDKYTQVQLAPKQKGNTSYNWYTPANLLSAEESPLVNLPNFFKDSIRLVVQSQYGCEAQKSIYLNVFPPLDKLFIPNAFTPDGNGLNDQFKPGNIEGATDYTLTIFNRWGEKLFVSHDPNHGWDGRYQGKVVQDGIYIFTVNFLYSDGQLYSEKGTVHVLR